MRCRWEIQLFNCCCVLEFQPSASGDDKKPFNILNNAIFLYIFILYFSCWLPKSDSTYAQHECCPRTSQIIDLCKVTCGEAGAQCTMSCGRNRWTQRCDTGDTRVCLNPHKLHFSIFSHSDEWRQSFVRLVTTNTASQWRWGRSLIGKLIKPLSCEIWEAVSMHYAQFWILQQR